MSLGMVSRARWAIAAVAIAATSLALAQQQPRNQGGNRAGNAAAANEQAPAANAPTVPAVPATVCVPQERTDAANACPAGAQNARYGTRSQTGIPAAVRAASEDRNKNTKAKNKQGPTVQLDAATLRRRSGLQRRSLQLLRSEVQLTATLARQTPTRDPHRADVLMRLAENLQELASAENAAAQELEETIFQARSQNNAQRVTALQREQQQHRTEAQNQRQNLIRTFTALVEDHPRYQRMDEVLFYLAFAYQDSNDMTNARRIYQLLIQRFPQSRYLPNAYLSFAEFFFEQGAMEEAETFYRHVIEINTPENQVRGYAMYKLAWVYYNLQRFGDALQQFYDVIEYARANRDNPGVAPLLRSARQELVTAYGSVYGVSRPLRTGEALNAFRRYGENEDQGFEMLERLGELYQDNGQWPNSIAVFHELMAQRPQSDRFCNWQASIAKAVVASRPRPEQMTEINRLIDVFDQFRAPTSTRSQQAKNQCRDAAARIIFDVASHWHLEAIGRSADGQQQTRGTRDATTMANAARLYNVLIERFPDLDSIEFPEYNRPDWPTRYRIAYYAADILRDQENFRECGPAYDRVVEMNPQGEFTEDAAYKAVLCYNDLFSSELARAARERPRRENTGGRTAGGEGGAQNASQRQREQQAAEAARLVPRDLNDRESGMLRAFSRYVCFVSASQAGGGAAGGARPAANAPNLASNDQEDPRTTLLTIRYRRAYLYYAASHFEEASGLFREIAFSDPSVPDPENLREIAADLYLDSLNVMGSRWNPPRPACFDGMERDVPELKNRFCNANNRSQHTEFCDRMDVLGCQILRKRAESLHNARRFAEAGSAYIDIVRNHRECNALPDARVDEVLYNAAIEFDAANMLGRSMRVRDVLVQRFLPRGSVWAQRALYRLAGNYHAIQVFSRAADNYEQYADYVNEHRQEATRADPEAVDHAADALRQATIFRIGLGEESRALENANKFARYFGTDPNRRRAAASVVFSIGRIYMDRAARLARQTGGNDEEQARRRAAIRQAWQDVVRHYTSFVNRYARNGTLDQQIQGNVALGRGYWHLEDHAHAQLYFRAATIAWGEQPAAAEGQPRPAAPGEARIREQLGNEAGDAIEKSRDAVAEARFYLAELVYERFTARRLPQFRGSGIRAFRTWEQRTLGPFITEQRRYLEQEATPLYQTVIAMHVPNWEIAAAARLADMYYQFAQYIRTADVSPDIRRQPELLDAYNVMRDEFTQRFINIAKIGFEGCIRKSTEVHWFNEWSQLCERNLNQIDRRQYPLADEVRAEPNLLFSRATNSRPVYQIVAAGDDEGEGGAPSDAQQPQQGGGGAGGGGAGGGGAAGGGARSGNQ